MNLEVVRNHRFRPLEHECTFEDSMLYALGLGDGADPPDRAELRVVDVSIVPDLVSGFANAVVMGIGWRAADLLPEDAD